MRLWNVALELDGHVADFELQQHPGLQNETSAEGSSVGGAGTHRDQAEDLPDPLDDDRDLSELADLLGLPHAVIRAEAYEVLQWTIVKGVKGHRRRRSRIFSGAR